MKVRQSMIAAAVAVSLAAAGSAVAHAAYSSKPVDQQPSAAELAKAADTRYIAGLERDSSYIARASRDDKYIALTTRDERYIA